MTPQMLTPQLVLKGDYAQLEPMAPEHVNELNSAAADGELWNLHFTSVPDSNSMEGYIERALIQRDAGLELPFVVRRLSDNCIVGSTRYYAISPENRNLSIGYTWYSVSAQRTPINTECKLMLLSHAFEELACISVQWHTDGENTRSQKAIQRLGAQFEGILRNDKIMPDGRIRHTHCFSMLDTEWPHAKSSLIKRLAR